MAAYEKTNGAIYQVFMGIQLIILQKLDTLSFKKRTFMGVCDYDEMFVRGIVTRYILNFMILIWFIRLFFLT